LALFQALSDLRTEEFDEWNNIPIPVSDCLQKLVAYCDRSYPVQTSADSAVNASLRAIMNVKDYFESYCKHLKQATGD